MGRGRMCASVPGVDAPDAALGEQGVVPGELVGEVEEEPVLYHPHHLAVRPGELVGVSTDSTIKEEDEYVVREGAGGTRLMMQCCLCV